MNDNNFGIDNTLIDDVFMRRIASLIILGIKIKDALTVVDGCIVDTSFEEGSRVVTHALKVAIGKEIVVAYLNNDLEATIRILWATHWNILTVTICKENKTLVCIVIGIYGSTNKVPLETSWKGSSISLIRRKMLATLLSTIGIELEATIMIVWKTWEETVGDANWRAITILWATYIYDLATIRTEYGTSLRATFRSIFVFMVKGTIVDILMTILGLTHLLIFYTEFEVVSCHFLRGK